MIGKIMKGIAGFYYVGVVESGVYECKAKGIFRKDKIKPLVGDDVEIEVLNEEEKLGNIVKILPRRSELIRPAVANIDQALVIFAAREPKPNLSLLDRFLVIMEKQDLQVIDQIIQNDYKNLQERSAIQYDTEIGRQFTWKAISTRSSSFAVFRIWSS